MDKSKCGSYVPGPEICTNAKYIHPLGEKVDQCHGSSDNPSLSFRAPKSKTIRTRGIGSIPFTAKATVRRGLPTVGVAIIHLMDTRRKSTKYTLMWSGANLERRALNEKNMKYHSIVESTFIYYCLYLYFLYMISYSWTFQKKINIMFNGGFFLII